MHSLEDLGSVSTPPPPNTSGRSSPSKSVLSLYRHSGSVAGSSRHLAAIPESDLHEFPSVNFHWPNWTSSTQKESPLTQKKQISLRFQCPFEIKLQNSNALFDRSGLSICKLAARQILDILLRRLTLFLISAMAQNPNKISNKQETKWYS